MSSRHAQCSTITPSATRQMWMNVHAAARPEGLTGEQRHGGCAVRAVQREVLRDEVAVTDEVVLLNGERPRSSSMVRSGALASLRPAHG